MNSVETMEECFIVWRVVPDRLLLLSICFMIVLNRNLQSSYARRNHTRRKRAPICLRKPILCSSLGYVAPPQLGTEGRSIPARSRFLFFKVIRPRRKLLRRFLYLTSSIKTGLHVNLNFFYVQGKQKAA